MTAGAAETPADVRRRARAASSLVDLDVDVSHCRACPRLVTWREQVARQRRAAYRDDTYWGRPVPGYGPAEASLVVVGLAPAAHGGNRTGRVFTGDRSGDWLYAALWRAGLANQPTSVGRDDGLVLHGTRVLAAVRCAPPANRPTPAERDACSPWLDRELQLLGPSARVVVALGGFAWTAVLASLRRTALAPVPRPAPRFGHGVRASLGPLQLLGCYHPSQQNTFTGRLTEPMLDEVLGTACALAGLGRGR